MYKPVHRKQKTTHKKTELFKFEPLAKRINRHLKRDGIVLNFLGYRDTILEYFRIIDNHLGEVFDMTIECNLWFQYFSDLEGLIQYKKLDLDLDLDILKASHDGKTPNNEAEPKIEELRLKILDFTAFLAQIEVQKHFFSRAAYQCAKLYDRGTNTMRYRSVN